MISKQLSAAKKKLSAQLLRPTAAKAFYSLEKGLSGSENIIGVGIDQKIVKGKLTGKTCIKVFVKKKLAENKIDAHFLVPKKVGNYVTDIEAVGEIYAQSYIYCYDCVDGGSSVAHLKVTAGTYGCMVKKAPSNYLMLSNNHVFANSNVASKGDLITQPGPADGGKHVKKSYPGSNCRQSDKSIAKLTDFEPIYFDGTPNTIDAAIAKPLPKARKVIPSIKEIGTLKGSTRATVGMRVMKSGRTTQFTQGIISSIDTDVRVNYGTPAAPLMALFTNQIIIRGLKGKVFSLGGDSGSLIVNENEKGVGLLFAGNNTITIANHIKPVLDRFKIEIATKGNITLNPLPAWRLINRSDGGEGPLRFDDRRPRPKLIKDLQKILISLGYDLGKNGADGTFGKKTLAAVKKFQRQNMRDDNKKLAVDGMVGARCGSALNRSLFC